MTALGHRIAYSVTLTAGIILGAWWATMNVGVHS